LVSALFVCRKNIKIPSQGEKQGANCVICSKGKKLALFVEAHYIALLIRLKRLIEVVEDGGGTLSVVLAGHPKLKNDRRSTMEEIGYRATVFSLDNLIAISGLY